MRWRDRLHGYIVWGGIRAQLHSASRKGRFAGLGRGGVRIPARPARNGTGLYLLVPRRATKTAYSLKAMHIRH